MTVVNLTKAQRKELRPMYPSEVMTDAEYAREREDYSAFTLKWIGDRAADNLKSALAFVAKRLEERDVLGMFEWGNNRLDDAANDYVWQRCNELTMRLDLPAHAVVTKEQLVRALLTRCEEEQRSAADHPLQSGLQVPVEHAKLRAWNRLLRELRGAVRHLNEIKGPGNPQFNFSGLNVHSLAVTPDGDLRIVYCRRA